MRHEEHGIGAIGACLIDLIGVDDKVFAKHGFLDDGTHLAQAFNVHAKIGCIGQHGHGFDEVALGIGVCGVGNIFGAHLAHAW